MIHLDTSFIIRALRSNSAEDRMLREWLRLRTPLAMSAVAWGEFLCGPLGPGQLELARTLIPLRLPFEDIDAVRTAELFNGSGRRRGTLCDCMVAAVALRADAPVATTNRSDFERFEAFGLRLA